MAASDTVGRRFTQLIQHLGISKNAFAISLDKTATVIQHLVDERNKPGYDLLCKVFEVYPQVSKDWLLLGQGAMLLAGPAGGASASATSSPDSVAAAEASATAEALSPPPPVPQSGPRHESAQIELSLPPLLATAPALTAEKPTGQAAAPAPVSASISSPDLPAAASGAPAGPLPIPASGSFGNPEAVLTAALHAQHLQHQLALAEQRNQHLLEQQRLMQQLLDFAQRR